MEKNPFNFVQLENGFRFCKGHYPLIDVTREELLCLKTTVDNLCDVVFKCQLKPKSIAEVLRERIANWNTLDETSAKERLLQIDMLLKSFEGNKKEELKDPIGEYWEMLYPKTSLPYKQLEGLIETLVFIDEKMEQFKKAGEIKMEEIYLEIKKSMLQRIINTK